MLVENLTLSDMVVPRYLYSDTCCTTESLIEIGSGAGLSLAFENTTSLVLEMLIRQLWGYMLLCGDRGTNQELPSLCRSDIDFQSILEAI